MEKTNVAELLRNCPKGMELDCSVYDNVSFVEVTNNDDYPITIKTKCGFSTKLTKYGQNINIDDAKCIIFPKGKTTWEGFHRPFEDGDIVTCKDRGSLIAFIYKERKNASIVKYHFALHTGGVGAFTDGELALKNDELLFATEEEKAKLFDAIKANGYKWNTETKTLEKVIEPKFKVGNWYQCTKDFFGKGVTFDKNTAYYCAIEGCLQGEYGCHIAIVKDLYDNFKLWTIKDAKDGDVLAAHEGFVLFKKLDGLNIKCYCTYHFMDNQKFYVDTLQNKDAFHPATEEEKKKLFDAIKDNSYKWNPDNKTLEKLAEPKFKVGDRIRHKDSGLGCTLGEYSEGISAYRTNIGLAIRAKDLEQWELAPNKFEINTLKPFDKVLVRDCDTDKWNIDFFAYYREDKGDYQCMTFTKNQCIPYESNQYLMGTTNNCNEYFKTWK